MGCQATEFPRVLPREVRIRRATIEKTRMNQPALSFVLFVFTRESIGRLASRALQNDMPVVFHRLPNPDIQVAQR